MQDGVSVPLPGAVGRGTEHPPKHTPFPLAPSLPGLCMPSCRPGSSKGLVAGAG